MMQIETFAGLPSKTDAAADIVVIGIPYGTPYEQSRPGHSAGAPAAIRQAAARYAAMLDHYDFDLGGPLLGDGRIRVVDGGDVPGDPLDPPGNRERATEAAMSVIDSGAVPVVLGGDDSIPIPFLRAYRQRGPLTVIQVDAHLDWRHEVNGITVRAQQHHAPSCGNALGRKIDSGRLARGGQRPPKRIGNFYIISSSTSASLRSCQF